jgi:hypothetical protein
MKRTALILIVFLPWAVGCRMTPTELVSKECGVAITMPGPPSYETSTFILEGKTVTQHQSRVLKDGVTYGFICTPVSSLTDGQRPQDAFASAKQGLLINGDRRLISEREVALQGRPGLDVVMEMTPTGQRVRHRLFMFQDVTIDASIIGSEADVALPAAGQFVESLRLVPS